MSFFRRVFRKFHLYVLWAMLAALFWGFVFGFVTDTRPEKKLTVYIDAPCDDDALVSLLMPVLPEGIRLIKVHPFSYAMFNEAELLNADLYLVPAVRAGDYIDSFLPLPGGGEDCWTKDGTAYGLRIYSAESGEGALADYIQYSEGDYYLFYGVNSPHAAFLTGHGDNAARELVDTIFHFGQEERR